MRIKVTITERIVKTVEVDLRDFLHQPEGLTQNELTFAYVECINEMKTSPQGFINDHENEFCVDRTIEGFVIDGLK